MLGQLHDLDLQLLRLFTVVVQSGGFSAAQGVLGLSQPSISQQMAKLETRLGYRLCSRGKGGFKLTPKGEELIKATRVLFESIEAFRHQANGVAGRLLGELRVGFSEALDPSVTLKLANAIARFRQRDESVQIELISAMPADMERLLLEQRLDLAIGYFSGAQRAFDYRPLFTEAEQLYCGFNHPLFSAPVVREQDLIDADRIEHPYRFLESDEPVRTGICSARTEQVEGALAFILSGRHIGFLPKHFAQPWVERGLLRAVGAAGANYEVPFQLARHRGQVPGDALLAFEEDLLAAFA